jgi:hypothetical protein
LQSDYVGRREDNHQNGQQEINSPRHESPSLKFSAPRFDSGLVSAMKNANASVVLNKMPVLIDHASRQPAA